MTDFLSPRRRIRVPARPAGLVLRGGQETLARRAEDLYRRARREGWTRERFYTEIQAERSLRTLRRQVKDNLIDHYRAPQHPRLRKRVPAGYTPRTLQESLVEMINYARDIEEDGADYVIIEEEGGYRAYVQPHSP